MEDCLTTLDNGMTAQHHGQPICLKVSWEESAHLAHCRNQKVAALVTFHNVSHTTEERSPPYEHPASKRELPIERQKSRGF